MNKTAIFQTLNIGITILKRFKTHSGRRGRRFNFEAHATAKARDRHFMEGEEKRLFKAMDKGTRNLWTIETVSVANRQIA